MTLSKPGEIRILLVDDDPEVLGATERILARAGYATTTATSGEDVLARLETFRPSLILSDREMPGMDGLELCRRIKLHPAGEEIFFILISGTHTQSEHQISGLEAGADGYILRPIANRDLLIRVETFARILELTRALRAKNAELEAALARVKSLSGLLPICSGCKKIRDNEGYWSRVERYIQEHSDATFTHSLCPHCVKKYFPDLDQSGGLEL